MPNTTITAKVRVNTVTLHGDGQSVGIGLGANYRADDNLINQEWAKYTPALSISMTVKAEVAENFPLGQAFLLTFTPED